MLESGDCVELDLNVWQVVLIAVPVEAAESYTCITVNYYKLYLLCSVYFLLQMCFNALLMPIQTVYYCHE